MVVSHVPAVPTQSLNVGSLPATRLEGVSIYQTAHGKCILQIAMSLQIALHARHCDSLPCQCVLAILPASAGSFAGDNTRAVTVPLREKRSPFLSYAREAAGGRSVP